MQALGRSTRNSDLSGSWNVSHGAKSSALIARQVLCKASTPNSNGSCGPSLQTTKLDASEKATQQASGSLATSTLDPVKTSSFIARDASQNGAHSPRASDSKHSHRNGSESQDKQQSSDGSKHNDKTNGFVNGPHRFPGWNTLRRNGWTFGQENAVSNKPPAALPPPKLNLPEVIATPEHRKKTNTARRSTPIDEEAEAAKRKLWAQMEAVHGNLTQGQKVSLTLRGKPKVCSICGEEGHNRRSCPQNKDERGKNGTRKMKPLTVAEREALEALRDQRREERKNRPKSEYKGLSWSITKAMWSAQVWDKVEGRTKNVGYFDDEIEAAQAYDQAVLRMRGLGADLNFPEHVEIQHAVKHSDTEPEEFPVGESAIVECAVKSILQAWNSGVRRQRIEFMLPVDSEGGNLTLRQDFQTVRNLTEALLVKLKQTSEFSGRMVPEWLDKSDFVAAWQSDNVAAVVLCSADCLTELRNIDGGDFGERLTLVVNPQWQLDGQIISDFGIGRGGREAEKFVSNFEPTFSMQRKRILGDELLIFKTHESKWQVHYVWPNKQGQLLIGAEKSMPTYETLLALLRRVPGSKSSQTWVERVIVEKADSEDDVPLSKSSKGLMHINTGKTVRSRSVSPSSGRDSSTKSSNDAPKKSEAPESDTAHVESIKIQLKPRAEIVRDSDRFAEQSVTQDVRLAPVMSLPSFSRQLLGNAFGNSSVDQREVAKTSEKKTRRKPRLRRKETREENSNLD